MRVPIIAFLLLALPAAAAPKLKPKYLDVTVGTTFVASPWVEPPLTARVVVVTVAGVDVRTTGDDGEMRMHVNAAGAYWRYLFLDAADPLPTVEQVQQIVTASKRGDR